MSGSYKPDTMHHMTACLPSPDFFLPCHIIEKLQVQGLDCAAMVYCCRGEAKELDACYTKGHPRNINQTLKELRLIVCNAAVLPYLVPL